MTTSAENSKPLISVIMATFNWSAALKCAIESVLQQTFTDFELLVIGDACTDDSEHIARSFGDRRVRWFNLPKNYSSQYGPNNFGIDHARGDYIAYLGHDDLWWPTHLSSMISKARQTGADVVAAVTICYGPPDSGMRSATGLFPAGKFNPRYFFPPSSMLHTRALIDTAGRWRSPAESRGPVDYDLLLRFHEHGATVATTGELTVFKFNAAWRRNSYHVRSAYEQAELLSRIRYEGETFRQAALMSIVQSVIEDRFIRIEAPPDNAVSGTVSHRIYGDFKGLLARDAPAIFVDTDAGVRFFIDEPYAGFEWHAVEGTGNAKWRWTGPSSRSSFYLPVQIDRPFQLNIRVNAVMGETPEAAFAAASLSVHDQLLIDRREKEPDGTWIWSTTLDPSAFNGKPIQMVTISFPSPRRPLDMGINDDRRWLGICISHIDLIPINR